MGYRNGKVIENSKEVFRQMLLKHFPDPDILTNKNRMDERKKLGENLLPQSILMETSRVYADIAEKITGEKIKVSENPREEIVRILDEKYGLIRKGEDRAFEGGAPLVVIAAGSDSDMPHLETLK